jgi:hypothetical protein
MLIVLLAAATGVLVVLLTMMAPLWVYVSVAGSVSCGLLL